ncbi:MAG: response regulator [Clostridia bacterium]
MEQYIGSLVFIFIIITAFILIYFVNRKNKKDESERKKLEVLYKKEQEEREKEIRKKRRIIWNKEIKKNLTIKQVLMPNKKLKVLVADYNSGMIKFTDSVLESMGIETELVESGYDILDLIQSGNKYDAIITNNMFRGCPDSYVILDELKEINGFNIPTIVLTVSMNQRNHFVNELGFNDYVEKPISIDKTKKALCSVINDLKFTKYKK